MATILTFGPLALMWFLARKGLATPDLDAQILLVPLIDLIMLNFASLKCFISYLNFHYLFMWKYLL